MSDYLNSENRWFFNGEGAMTRKNKAYYTYDNNFNAQYPVGIYGHGYTPTKSRQWILTHTNLGDFPSTTTLRIASIPIENVAISMYLDGYISDDSGSSATAIDVGLAYPATEDEFKSNTGRTPLYSARGSTQGGVNEYQKYFGTINDDRTFTETGVSYPRIRDEYRGLQQFSGVMGEGKLEGNLDWLGWKEGICVYNIRDIWDNWTNLEIKNRTAAANTEYRARGETNEGGYITEKLPSTMDITLTPRDRTNAFGGKDAVTIIINVKRLAGASVRKFGRRQ